MGKIPASRTKVDENPEAEQQPERLNETQEKSNEASGQIEEVETFMAERSNSGATERANGRKIANDERIGNETAPMVQSTSGGRKSEGKKIRRNGGITREKEALGFLFKPGLE